MSHQFYSNRHTHTHTHIQHTHPYNNTHTHIHPYNNTHTHTYTHTFWMMSRLPSATMGAEPLVQLNSRKEPLAEQFRTTVLLCSMASGRLDLMTRSDTGSAGRNRNRWPTEHFLSTRVTQRSNQMFAVCPSCSYQSAHFI